MASITSTVKSQYLQQVSSDGSMEKHHFETETDQVLVSTALTGVTVSKNATLQTALQAIATQAATGGVTGVKGNSESSYRTGNVNITAANIGLGNVNNTADSAKPVSTAQAAAIKAAQDTVQGNLDTYETATNATLAALQTAVENADSKAEGRSSSRVYKDVAAMKTALKAMSATELKVGDNIYLTDTDIPDYWVSAVLTTNSGDYGYYQVSVLETNKVDLSSYVTSSSLSTTLGSYQTKSDTSLNTTSKTVVGAINELKQSLADSNSISSENISDINDSLQDIYSRITDVENGDLVAAKATNATTASGLDHDVFMYFTINSGTNSSNNNIVSSRSEMMTDDESKASPSFGRGEGYDDDSEFNDRYLAELTLGNSGVTAGTYGAVQVNSKGIVVAGNQTLVSVSSLSDSSINTLAVGGICLLKS